MVAWRVAKCLLTLRDQWKAAHPGAANPGFIGDAAHAARTSDHNPWVDDPTSPVNVVTAGDFYHQPSIGADAGQLAEALKAAKDPRVKYVIWNRRIWSLARDAEDWRPYNGPDPHTGHAHVSVTSSWPVYDRTGPWDIGEPPPGEDDFMALFDSVEEFTAAVAKGVEAGVGNYMGRFMKDEAGTGDTLRDEAQDRGRAIVAAVKAGSDAIVAAIRGSKS